jgi:AraC-like DNA-binding protein
LRARRASNKQAEAARRGKLLDPLGNIIGMSAIWVVVVGSIGVGQGVLLGAALLARRSANPANVFLVGTVFALAGLLLGDVLRHAGAVARVPALDGAFDGLLLVVGPSIWFYVHKLIEPAWRPRAGLWPHLLPAALISLSLWLGAALGEREPAMAPLEARLAQDPAERNQLTLVALQMLVYLLLSGLAVRRWRARLAQQFSNAEGRRLRWLMILLAASAGLLGIWLASWGRELALADLMTAVALSSSILGFGIFGLRQRPLPVGLALLSSRADEAGSAGTDQRPAASAAPRRNPQWTEQLNELRERLESLMRQERLFLEAELSLGDVCTALQAKPHQLSQVLNGLMKQSFYDYVNGLRVVEVQRCLRDPAYDGQTVLEIALASGFASKATFNAVFKKHVGTTPSSYRKLRGPVA